MLLCEVNTHAVEKANAMRCTVRTREGMALYMPAGIYINCCRKMAILQTTVPLFNSHIMRTACLLQCVNTELQPVVTSMSTSLSECVLMCKRGSGWLCRGEGGGGHSSKQGGWHVGTY